LNAFENDPLGHQTTLSYHGQLTLLGVSVNLNTNHPDVLKYCHTSIDSATLQIDIVVSQSTQAQYTSTTLPKFTHRLFAEQYIAGSGNNLLTANRVSGKALAFIEPELLKFKDFVQRNIVECLALMLITAQDRLPIHAGAVVHNNKAALFVGNSGAGKSTLTYACVREGFSLLAEDTIFISKNPQLSLWGIPEKIHLCPDAPNHFPELKNQQPQIQPNGKNKIALSMNGMFAQQQVFQAHQWCIFILQRHDQKHTSINKTTNHEFLNFFQQRDAGFDIDQQTLTTVEKLVDNNLYQLKTGSDLQQATLKIKQILEKVAD
jgi:hypothetical protein